MTEPRRCSICTDAVKNQWVAARHLEGHSATAMEESSRNPASPVPKMKRETIGKHIKACLGTDAKPSEIKAVAATVVVPPDTKPGDVAVLVQQEVVRKLRAGEGRVTVQHGLQAQQLMDRRSERQKDREVAVTLARLLHSAGPPPEIVRARPIEAIGANALPAAEGHVVVEVTRGD